MAGTVGAETDPSGIVTVIVRCPVHGMSATHDISPNLPNSEVGLVYMVGKHVAAFGALKALILALFDEKAEDNPDNIFVPFLAGLCEENNAFGRCIDYSTTRKLTRENKVQMVIPNWTPVQQSDEDVAAMQAWLNSLVGGAAPAKTA